MHVGNFAPLNAGFRPVISNSWFVFSLCAPSLSCLSWNPSKGDPRQCTYRQITATTEGHYERASMNIIMLLFYLTSLIHHQQLELSLSNPVILLSYPSRSYFSLRYTRRGKVLSHRFYSTYTDIYPSSVMMQACGKNQKESSLSCYVHAQSFGPDSFSSFLRKLASSFIAPSCELSLPLSGTQHTPWMHRAPGCKHFQQRTLQ